MTALPHPGDYVKPDGNYGMTQQVTTRLYVATRVRDTSTTHFLQMQSV